MATGGRQVPGKLKSTPQSKRRYQPYSRNIRKEVNRVYDRIYATIYGHCVGDALGLLTETLTKEEAKKKYKEVHKSLELVHKKILPDIHRRKWDVGDWTDESDQMLLVLQSLLKNSGQVIPKDFARRLMEWSERGFPELDDVCGNGACAQVKGCVTHPQFSEAPEKAAEIVWRDSRKRLATNSAVSRSAVLGVHNYTNLGQVIKNSVDFCKITHPDIRCQASCVALSVAIALLLQKNARHIKKNGNWNMDGVIDETYNYAQRILSTPEEVKELKKHMYAGSLKELNLDEPGMTNYTYKTLGAGIWAARQKDFRQAIQDIVMEGGDADANAAVAGAILGCKFGAEAIPWTWIEALANRVWLDDLLDRYFDIVEGRKLKRETTL